MHRLILPPKKGTANGRAKLQAEDITAIRAAATAGALQKDLAEYYGVHPSVIGRIVRRDIWRHI